MCQDGKCYCLDVETGALIFAIPNLMIKALGTAICIGFLIYINVAVDRLEEIATGNTREVTLAFGLAVNYILSIALAVASIGLAFAICLVVGICKRNPNYVKTYFISGIMLMCIWGIFVLSVLFSGNVEIALAGLIGFTIYGLILHMIRMTYMKFQRELTYTQFTNPLVVTAK